MTWYSSISILTKAILLFSTNMVSHFKVTINFRFVQKERLNSINGIPSPLRLPTPFHFVWEARSNLRPPRPRRANKHRYLPQRWLVDYVLRERQSNVHSSFELVPSKPVIFGRIQTSQSSTQSMLFQLRATKISNKAQKHLVKSAYIITKEYNYSTCQCFCTCAF
jgi:hypothetical protein